MQATKFETAHVTMTLWFVGCLPPLASLGYDAGSSPIILVEGVLATSDWQVCSSSETQAPLLDRTTVL